MAQWLSRQVLKVDATAVTIEDSRNYLILYNCNVPEQIIYDNNASMDAFSRIGLLLENDFGRLPVYFQITGAYYLKHKVTDQEYLWTGSFHPKINAPAQLTEFYRFIGANNFAQFAFNSTRQPEESFTWVGRDTQWTFDRLEAIIINSQCEVNSQNDIFQKRGLMQHRYGGRRRNQKTFPLP